MVTFKLENVQAGEVTTVEQTEVGNESRRDCCLVDVRLRTTEDCSVSDAIAALLALLEMQGHSRH